MEWSNSSSPKSRTSLLEDFWNELDNISVSSGPEASQLSNEFDDDYQNKFECEAEAEWLRQAGLEEIVNHLEGNNVSYILKNLHAGDDEESPTTSCLEELLAISLAVPLTERQTKTVKKRFNTLKTTLIKQNNKPGQLSQITANSKQRPDVRSLFNTQNCQSHATVPKCVITETDGVIRGLGNKYNLELSNCKPHHSSESDLMLKESTSSSTSGYGKYTAIDYDNANSVPNYMSVKTKPDSVKKESRFSWSGHKKGFNVTDNRRHSTVEKNETGVEMLSLKYLSTIRRAGSFVTLSTQHGELENKQKDLHGSTENIDHITPETLGIAIEMRQDANNRNIQEPKLNRSYVVRLEDFNCELQKKIKLLAHIELTAVFDSYDLDYEKMKGKKTKKKFKKNLDSVFGISLVDLHDKDKNKQNNCRIPFVLQILLDYIHIYGLKEEGIFRISGTQHRLEDLKTDLNYLCKHFSGDSVKSNEQIIDKLNKYSIYDICNVLKQFIRDLPDPLLSSQFLEAFLNVPKISDYLSQLKVMNLLILLLAEANRNSLEAFLSLLNQIILNASKNKMTIHNVATVMAPNLFPNLKSHKNKKASKSQEQKEMALTLERANDSIDVTKMLISCYRVLFQVPPYLVEQIQVQNQSSKFH